MIKSFHCRQTQKLFNREKVPKLPDDIQKIGLRKLWMLDAAITLNDLKVPPGNRLEKLKNDRKGQYSIRINDQWRICFKWEKDNAYDVEIVDYH